MIKELTAREEQLIFESVLTRINAIKKLIEGWEKYPDKNTDSLINSYSEDLKDLKEIEKKLLVI